MSDNGKRILVVDDVEEILSGLSGILMAEGYDVLQASNGVMALQMLDENIDMVITDILMPEMDGIELSQKIKDKFPDVELILISGGGRQPAGDHGYDYLKVAKKLTGVESILKKPFDPEKLIELVNSKLS